MAPQPRASGGNAEVFAIGDVARATGLSTHTIRVWERRYGKPVPERLPSGQRRYSMEQVRWLRLVAEALALGHRPSKAVPAAEAQLTAMLESRTEESEDPQTVAALFQRVRDFDAEAVNAILRQSWEQLGPQSFLKQLIAPLVVAVGRAWAEGALQVRHEHFVSELLEDFLRGRRQEIELADDAPVMLFAGLEPEHHSLGLQMAGLIAVLCGVRSRILGIGTPLIEIVGAAREEGVFAVGISVSLATGGVETDRELAALRTALPDEIALVIGGTGARGVRRGTRGVDYLASLGQLEDWLRAAARGTRGSSR